MDKIQIKALTYTALTVIGCFAVIILLFWRPELFCGLLLLGCFLALLGFFVSEMYKGYLKSLRDKE